MYLFFSRRAVSFRKSRCYICYSIPTMFNRFLIIVQVQINYNDVNCKRCNHRWSRLSSKRQAADFNISKLTRLWDPSSRQAGKLVSGEAQERPWERGWGYACSTVLHWLYVSLYDHVLFFIHFLEIYSNVIWFLMDFN